MIEIETEKLVSNWLNIVCSGKFHYLYYAHKLLPDVIENVYFSHRISTHGNLPAMRRRNLFIKEYLTGAHLKFLGEFLIIPGLIFYNRIWELQLSKSFRPAKVNLFLLHGNCISTIKAAKKDGVVVGEAVNLHPTVLWQRLSAEARRLGMPIRVPSRAISNLLAEISEIDYLLCPSKAVANSYIQMGFDPEKIFTIPYGVSSTHIGQSNSPASDQSLKPDGERIRKILCVGQITLRKGQHRLLDLIGQYCDDRSKEYPEVTFIGRADPKYLELLRSHRVPFTVENHVEHSALMRRFRDYDVFCLASIEDGFAMVVLEAASAGIRCIVSRYAGASELIEGIEGFSIFDPFKQDEFDCAFDRVQDFEGRTNFNASSHSWNSYADKLRLSLESVLKEN